VAVVGYHGKVSRRSTSYPRRRQSLHVATACSDTTTELMGILEQRCLLMSEGLTNYGAAPFQRVHERPEGADWMSESLRTFDVCLSLEASPMVAVRARLPHATDITTLPPLAIQLALIHHDT
jgi:hypothetical protein